MTMARTNCCQRPLLAAMGTEVERGPKGPVAWLFVKIVRFYQTKISPLTPPACRFSPSCSEYTRQALIKHGAIRGSVMGARRILRCHPFNPGGHDPVP
jgi:hypothetical protein